MHATMQQCLNSKIALCVSIKAFVNGCFIWEKIETTGTFVHAGLMLGRSANKKNTHIYAANAASVFTNIQ